jgi:hypothetical protein
MLAVNEDTSIKEKTQALKEEIERRIEDLIAQDPDTTGLALTLVSLGIFSRQYPAEIDSEERRLIMDNYPEATDDLIAERAMSQSGVNTAIGTAVKMARIAHDYSPLSNISEDIKNDFSLPDSTRSALQDTLIKVFVEANTGGISAFGVATMMIMTAVQVGLIKGVSGLKMMRPLLQQMTPAMEKSEIENRERVLQQISKKMRISKEEAEKYLKDTDTRH